jgi:hypothetical protein
MKNTGRWLNSAIRCTSYRARCVVTVPVLSVAAAHRHLATAGGPPTTRSNATSGSTSNKNDKAAPDSAEFSAVGASLQRAGKESRFIRSNGVNSQNTTGAAGHGAQPTSTVSVDGAEVGVSAPALSLDVQLAHVTLPPSIGAHRSLLLYLQRVHNVLCSTSHVSVVAVARRELCKILLPAINGLDASLVTLLLQTLRLADVQSDAPVVQDAVAWLSLYGYHASLTQFVELLVVLSHFEVSLVGDWVRSLPQRLKPSDVSALTMPQTVALLTTLLPCLRYPTPTATSNIHAGKGEGGAAAVAAASAAAPGENIEGSLVDASLVELADGLRERCKGTELVTCDAALTAGLLQALLAFRSSREWSMVADKVAWTALMAATCSVLATPTHVRAMGADVVVELLDGFYETRQNQLKQVPLVSLNTDKAEHVSAALIERLTKDVQALQSATPSMSAELPTPWRPRGLRVLWCACLKHRASTVTVVVKADSDGQIDSLYHKALDDAHITLLCFMSDLFARHPGDVGVAEMAFSVARDIADADRAAVQRARELLPVTPDTSPSLSAAAAAAPIWSSLPDILPPGFVEALRGSSSNQLQASSIAWTPTTVKDAITLFEHSSDDADRMRAFHLAQRWYKQLQARGREGERLLPQELLAFFTPELLRKERLGVDTAVDVSLRRWSVSEVLYFLSHLNTRESTAHSLESMAVLRQAGTALCTYAAKASAAQLAALVECYGAARVRNDDFCEAAVKRLAELLDVSLMTATRSIHFTSDESVPMTSGGAANDSNSASPGGGKGSSNALGNRTTPVTLPQLTQLLRSFALMEVRQSRPFIDAAPHVTLAASEDQGSAQDVTQLLAAYAKMLIWNYPVYRALAERLCRIRREDVRLSELVTAQLALLRMDLSLPAVTERFYEALTERYGAETVEGVSATSMVQKTEQLALSSRAALEEAVMHLSLLSRLRTASFAVAPDPCVRAGIVQVILQRAEILRMDELAEVLLSLARLGEGKSSAFEALTVRTLGLLPTAPPRVMARVAEAYALAGRGDDAELFTLIAERTISSRHDMAAITIASILASFAKADVRNDRLFIEVIPRVRHVCTYGTPRDIVNVVSAYAAVGLWHYKLFARLADRAIQLRADFRVNELVRLLAAYAAVQMRYDVLFTEFAPRIQTLAHLLTSADVASIVSSYSALSIPCVPVWKAMASRAVAVVDTFTAGEAEQLLDGFSSQGFYNEECVTALTERFPALASIPFDKQTTEDTKPAEKPES